MCVCVCVCVSMRTCMLAINKCNFSAQNFNSLVFSLEVEIMKQQFIVALVIGLACIQICASGMRVACGKLTYFTFQH